MGQTISEYKKHVLKDRREFSRLFDSGTKQSTKNVQLIFVAGVPHEIRFAVCVAKRYGNSVKRNRLKRILRKAVMDCLPFVKRGWVIAVLPNGNTVGLTSQIVTSQIRRALEQAQLISMPAGENR